MAVVGIDCDGVLCNFTKGYAALLTAETGIVFTDEEIAAPATWYWDRAHGVTREQEDKVWKQIKSAPAFWYGLDALPRADAFLVDLSDSSHEVYFITDRPGYMPQTQTQMWLQEHGYACPSVCISRNGKGAVAAALKLDVYIDDKGENVLDVIAKSPTTRTYKLRYPYNEAFDPGPGMTVDTLDEFWQKAGL